MAIANQVLRPLRGGRHDVTREHIPDSPDKYASNHGNSTQQDGRNTSSESERNPYIWNFNFQNMTSSDQESGSDDPSTHLLEALRQWINMYEIKANAVDALLKILRENGHTYLPASSRTLLHTPRNVELLRVSDMNYYHFGLETMMIHTLKKYRLADIQGLDTLHISLNIDGLPLFKSSNTSAWPVLGVINNLKPLKPFPITLTVGCTKPSNLDFLNEAIAEYDHLRTNGIHFNETEFDVKLTCIICDAPARAYVKCVKQYSGYFGCDKCNQRGSYTGRMTFPVTDNLELRTDDSFRNQDQEEHHKQNMHSPFLNLPVDMVWDFPIDYMHQVCLGVTKKLIISWVRSPRPNVRLSAGHVGQISAKLISLAQFMPCEFSRKPRSLDVVDRWKATEFRQFLLYTGQFALRGILPNRLYRHFMCLSIALNILVNQSLVAHYSEYAHRLLTYFVRKSRELYGEEFCVYNVHSLLHLGKEAEKFGSLDKCAAWPFENYMQQLKRKISGGNNPAAQLVKRVLESMESDCEKDPIKVKKIRYKKPNNLYRTNRDKYCELIRPTNREAKSFLCRVYHSPENSFTYPCNSDLIGHAQFGKLNYNVKTLNADELVIRCLRMPSHQENKVVFVPLQHDFEI